MSEALYERLQRLKRQQSNEQNRATDRDQTISSRDVSDSRAHCDRTDPVPPESRESLERLGFIEQSDGAFVRSIDREIGFAAGRVIEMRKGGGMIVPAGAREPVFYDVESTGLGAGAGNVAFLVGAVTVVGQTRLHVEQTLLPDYPDEPLFLKRTAQLLSSDRLAVSYNGKGFDTNLLRSRFLMNGIRWSEPEQLDLLYTVRRLWGRVFPDCRLSTVEKLLLGVERGRDVPGAEVPDRYFAFLETGAGEVLRDVIAHHEQDMLSLVLLFDAVEQTMVAARHLADGAANVSSAEIGAPVAADPVGVARALLTASGVDAAVGWLYHACADEQPIGNIRRAMVLLAGLLKKRAQFEEAARLWSRLFHEGQSALAGIELAKHLEHREKNIPAAITVCEKLLHHTGTAREDIEHRYRRLRRKASR